MINFQPEFSFPVQIATVLIVVGLWGFQIYYLTSNKSARVPLKILLNSLLFIVILGFVFQPAILRPEPQETTLIHPANQRPSQSLIDSLAVKNVTEINDFGKDPKDIILFGQSYTYEDLYRLPVGQVQWIPQSEAGEIAALSWEAILQLGEIQQVKGVIVSDETKEIRLEHFGETVANASVTDSFEFSFPVLTLGRNEYSLIIDDYQVGVLRFFVSPPAAAVFQLLFGFPNPEARFLAGYLVKRGEKANMRVQITRDGQIVLGSLGADVEPQIYILDPSQIQSQKIREAKQIEGTNFMVINLSNPLAEINAINSVFGTNFSLEKIAEGTRELDNGVSALGYQFVEKNNQTLFLEKSVSISYQGANQIAVSLIDGTYPLAMAGDSMRYSKIWEPVLAELSPVAALDYSVRQPVYSKVKTQVEIAVKDSLPEFLLFQEDTVFLQHDHVNDSKAYGSILASTSGWQVLNDSLEIYVHASEDFEPIHDLEVVSSFLRDRRGLVPETGEVMKLKFIPDWVWMLLFVLLLGMIWLEPRV